MPGGLGNCAKVLGTPLKDKEGTRLINKLSRPVSATKNRPKPYWDFTNAWDDYLKFYSYCADDVRAEDGAAALIPDLTPYERATWLTDQTINARGVRVDMVALHAMQRIMTEMFAQYVAELTQITNGVVDSASKVAALGEWLGTQGVHMADMKADTVDEKLEELEAEGWTENVAYRALQIRSILSSANIKKIPTLLLRVSSDGRLRDQYSYCGADRTGRWSAGGVQLQNITAKGPKSAHCEGCGKHFNPRKLTNCPRCGSQMWHKMNDWTVEAVMDAKQDIINNGLAFVEQIWGDPATVLCGCLRGLFVAKEGTRFICCDYAAIEAVIAACLARCQWRIEVFEGHGKIYEMSASLITGTPLDTYVQYAHDNGFDHPDRKKIGKVAELASGYGGWIGAYRNFGAEGTDEEIKAQVLAWRAASPEIEHMWGGQFVQIGPKPWNARPELFGLEGMAIMAILKPGQQYWYNDIAYHVHEDILYCRLPSGRFLTYHRPRLIDGDDKLERGPCYKIIFEGWNSNSQKGKIGWHVLETYGGRLFENICQAVGADIQAECLVRLEQRGYPVAMHTHDEAIAEMQYGTGSIDEMCAIMSERPEWAGWWPIKAAGWEHSVYQKD
jgi:DNA polymerase